MNFLKYFLLLFRGGVELRVWKAILKWRREHRMLQNADRSDAAHRMSRLKGESDDGGIGGTYSESPDTTD